ncbi:hypothetical protein LCGC14_0823110 [marine sediment metagenome]|uniref:Neutral zinc metallopeptidase n=1 Tax=marine sediment metagenome TaxID=412755 RepID=A0A0F9S316_9ZZZZ
MKWRGKSKSQHIEDRRNQRLSGMGQNGGSSVLRLLPAVFKLLGFKGTLFAIIVILGLAFFTGNLPQLLAVLGLSSTNSVSTQSVPLQESSEEKQLVEFVSVVLADTEQTWTSLFAKQGKDYQKPTLVLFRDQVNSACGRAQAAMGPFYCPADQQVYIDLSFYKQLERQLNAPGDFAQAYVIAHEVGHHVQTLLGISQKVHASSQSLSQVEANKLSVKQELQADCFAGIWAFYADKDRQLLESGDIEEGLAAASAIGDDTLQKQSQGVVRPDSFTHGSSAQRVSWFKTGYQSGSVDSCNTFE